MSSNKDTLLWDEVQKESKRILDEWKTRNKQSSTSLSSLVPPDNIDEEKFLNERLSTELSAILEYWHTNRSLDKSQKDQFHKCAQYLLNLAKDHHVATKWLNEHGTLLDSIKKCADDIAAQGYHLAIEGAEEDSSLESYDSLIQAFSNIEYDPLLDAIMRCVATRFYIDTLYHLSDVNARTLTLTQKFLLITCPDYILTCDRDKSHCAKLLEYMLPHYTKLFARFLPKIEQWTDTVVLCLLYPIRFILADSSHVSLEQKLAIQEALVMILCKQPVTGSNVEQEHITLVHTVLRVLFQFVRSDPKLLSELRKQTIADKKLLDILKQLSKNTRYEKLQLSALELLALLVPEEEFTKANDSAKVANLFVRNFNQVIEEGKESTANELLQGLKSLVQSDEMKQQVVKQNALPSLMQYTKEVTDNPAPLELAYALSFNPEAKEIFSKDQDFIDHVKEMRESDNENVTKAAHGIMWKLEGEDKFIEEADAKKASEEKAKGDKPKEEKSDKKKQDEKKTEELEHYDMMISYCWAQKELCHKINDRLENDGYSVWLDRDEMHGSIVESMSEAVENSGIVLLCMSSNYKMSVNCQAEAEYAFNRKSKIIPLMVEKDYKPDGWLGFMAGSKLYIDFADKEDEEFDKAYELLIAELKKNDAEVSAKNEQEKVEAEPATKEIESPPIQTREYLNVGPAPKWTEEHVHEFLTDHQLDPLLPICKSMNGATLLEFHDVCQRMPYDMYRLLDKKDDHPVSFNVFFKFIAQLKEYLPPPKPPQKVAFECNFTYPPSSTNTASGNSGKV